MLVFVVLIVVPCIYSLRFPDKRIQSWDRGGNSQRLEFFGSPLRRESAPKFGPEATRKVLESDRLPSRTRGIQGLAAGLHDRVEDEAYWFYYTQLRPFINYNYSPLPLKEATFAILVALLVLACYRARATQAGPRWFQRESRGDWAVLAPLLALLLWSSISLLYSPTPYFSLTTYALMVMGILWFALVYQMPKSWRLVRRWFNAVLLAGGVVAFFALLQDIDRNRIITRYLFVDLTTPSMSDPTLLRLRLGSLIGHNIGVASLISFSWFIILSRLFLWTTPLRRIGLGLLALLFIYIFFATQTRGIWIVLAVLTPIHVIWLMRLTGRRWDLKPILGFVLLVLIILLLQAVDSPRNPFYSPEAPLVRRLKDLTPSHLMTETRLRIAVTAMPLVWQSWRSAALGHGLGSFQYVFPRAQGEYFARHPDTLLAPTSARTVQAHSDWLQLLIELGIPGLLIVLAGLYALLRHGYNGWRAQRGLRRQVELTAALMGVAGLMIHALADFPVHVVSSAATALFMLAVWSSCGRIRPTVMATRAQSAAAPATRPRLSGLAAIGFASLVLAATISVGWFYSLLHVSMLESIGTSYRIYFGDHFGELTRDEQRDLLVMAQFYFDMAAKLAPQDREATFRQGEAAVLRGDLLTRQFEEETSNPQRQRALRHEADGCFRQALDRFQAAYSEVRYHEVFYYFGMAWEDLWRLYRIEDYRLRAKEFYYRAIRYSPSFTRAHMRLFRLLVLDRPWDPDEMRRIVSQVARYDPALFAREFVVKVLRAVALRRYAEAAQGIDVLIENNRNDPQWWLLKAHLLSYTGRGPAADAVLDEVGRTFPQATSATLAGYRMSAAASAGRYAEAVALAADALATSGAEPLAPFYRMVRAAALEKLGKPEAKAEWDQIEAAAAATPGIWNTAAEVWLFLLRDRDRAYPYILRACRPGQLIDPGLCRVGAEIAHARGEEEKARELLDRYEEWMKEYDKKAEPAAQSE
jgi:O-antigen ligase/tetratricopeptide (TPR) repeat protein